MLPAFVMATLTRPPATVAPPVCAPLSAYVICLREQASVAFRVTARPEEVQQVADPVTGVPPPLGVTE